MIRPVYQDARALLFFGSRLCLWGLFLAGSIGLLAQPLHGEILRDIQKRGIFRVGVKDNLPLLGQADSNGTLSGFEIELAEAIATLIWGENRLELDYIPLLNSERLPAIADGTVDIAIANIHITEPRRRVVAFSQPYLESQTRFVARDQGSLKTIKDGVIGVLQGSVAISRVRAAFPNTRLLGVSSYTEAIQKLSAKEIDSFAGDRLILTGWQYGSSVGSSWHYSETGLGVSQIAIAMPKGLQYRNLHQAIDLAIQTLESTGQLQQMRNKWRLSEADGAAVVRLDKSLVSSESMTPGSNESKKLLSICCYGSIINLSLFDSPIGVAWGRIDIHFSTSSQDSSGGKKLVGTSRKVKPVQWQYPRVF